MIHENSHIQTHGYALIRRVGVLFLTLFFAFLYLGPPHVLAQTREAELPAIPIVPQKRLGVVNTPEDFDRLLRALGSSDLLERDEAASTLEQMGEIAVPALIQLGLWNPDNQLRQNAVTALAKIGSPARDPLLKALKDKETRVRAGAAQALGILADPITMPALVRVLGDKASAVRQEAFSALSALGPATTPALIQALVDPHPDIERNAAVLLQKTGRSAAPFLIRALTHKNPKMRSSAARILGRIGDPAAIPHLVPILGDSQEGVREQAVLALAQFKGKAVKPLTTLLRGSNTTLHEPAFSALRSIGAPVIPELSRFIQESAIPYPLRAQAGRILYQFGWTPKNITARIWGNIVTGEWEKIPQVSHAMPPLMITMGDPLEEVRRAASKGVVPFGAKAVTALATEILRRRDPFFLQSAAETLGEINIRDFLAVEALTGLLQNRSPSVQSAVIKTLGKIGNYIAILPLLGVVEDRRQRLEMRILAVEALEKLGDPRIVPRLVAILQGTKDISFQKALIYTLGQLRSAEAAPILIKRLADDNPPLRTLAGEAIIKLRPLPIAALIDQLADPHPVAQTQASLLLSKIGEPAVEQLITTLKQREVSPSIKAQAELLLVKVLEALPGNVDVLIKALDAPSDRVRLLAVQSLSEIKTIKAVPSLLDIAEQEWRYPAHLRDQAKSALDKIKGNVDSQKWEGILEQRRLTHFNKLSAIGQMGMRMLYAVLGYWFIMSLMGILFYKVSASPPLSYKQHLAYQISKAHDEPGSRATTQKWLRAGFPNLGGGLLFWLLLTGSGVALLVWGRIMNSIAGTLYVWGALFAFGCWLQSPHGVERMSRFLSYRKRAARFLLAPLTYLGSLLFPMTEVTVGEALQSETIPVVNEPEPPAPLPEEPLTSFAMLLAGFSRSERIDILQGLGEHAARFPPVDPQAVLNFTFKETQEQIRVYKDSGQQEDVRAFLKTLVPMTMALSQKMEEIPETLSKMVALVGTSNSLVKLERFFAEVLSAVEYPVLKGAFPIILELLQAGFFPTTELIEEAKTAEDRPLLYYSWGEVMTTKIQKDRFNMSDPMHIALYYTAFRQRTNQSRILNLLGYTSHYADYKKIVDQWKKGSQKNAERIRHLREITEQFEQFIKNMDARNMVLAGPWLTRRLEETFGVNGHPANWLFVVHKSGVGMVPSFLTLDSKIPLGLQEAQAVSGAARPAEEPPSVDAFDALMSQ